MNLIYADPALRNNLGHHANSCRHISTEVRKRGIATAVLAYLDVTEQLQQELAAVPWFRCNTYGTYDKDPVCGWLSNFEVVARTTQEDLTRLAGVTADDVLYLNSAQPSQFMGVVRWAKSLPIEQRPTVILEFGTDAGLEARETPEGLRFDVIDPRRDPRATLHRYTARLLTEEDRSWLRLATFDRQSSDIFQMLLEFPVGTLPLPQRATTSCRDRTGKRPITIGILGHQRLEKGYAIVPELAARLLGERDDIRLLIHNGWPEGLVEQQRALRALADRDPRLILNEQTADLDLWSRLLDETDLIVCPYDRNRFVSSYSAVASEAVSNAIPMVVPEGTTLAGVLREFGSPGAAFSENTVESVFSVIIETLINFDDFARKAKQASQQWETTRGASRLVDALLSFGQQRKEGTIA
jgi:hypothetical protein